MFADIDAQGWVQIIAALGGAIGSIVASIYAAKAHSKAASADTKTDIGNRKLDVIAVAAEELEKQGNSRWEAIKNELAAARLEIRGLQQLRMDDAAIRHNRENP